MFIGPFFYITKGVARDSGIIADLLPVEFGNERGGKLDNDMGHQEMFEDQRWDKFAEYDEVSRGRVVFDIAAKEAVIYIDRCIEKYLPLVLEKFKLEKYHVETDEHYTCPGCSSFVD